MKDRDYNIIVFMLLVAMIFCVMWGMFLGLIQDWYYFLLMLTFYNVVILAIGIVLLNKESMK